MQLQPVIRGSRIDKTTLSLRLDSATFDQLQREAERIGISLSEAVRQLIINYLASQSESLNQEKTK